MSFDDPDALKRFIARLNRARHIAGEPSYGEMQTRSIRLAEASRGQEVKLIGLSHSSTQRTLTGDRLSMPPWPWVLSYITVLQVVAREAGVSPQDIGTLNEWKQWHEAARGAAPARRGRRGAEGRRGRIAGGNRGGRPPVSVVLPPDEVADAEEEELRLRLFRGLIKGAGAPQWWDSYVDVISDWLIYYIYLESIATRMRVYVPGLIPGLLQVEAYAHAVVKRNYPEASASHVARLVELRLGRQRRLQGPGACQLWAVVDEEALRDERVSKRTRRRQLIHLIDIAEQRNVAIGVLPSSSGYDNVTERESVCIFRFTEPEIRDVVCVEQPSGGVFHYRQEDTARHSQRMEIVSVRAFTNSCEARDLLWGILKET